MSFKTSEIIEKIRKGKKAEVSSGMILQYIVNGVAVESVLAEEKNKSFTDSYNAR